VRSSAIIFWYSGDAEYCWAQSCDGRRTSEAERNRLWGLRAMRIENLLVEDRGEGEFASVADGSGI
jgi:hypothetical protein